MVIAVALTGLRVMLEQLDPRDKNVLLISCLAFQIRIKQLLKIDLGTESSLLSCIFILYPLSI